MYKYQEEQWQIQDADGNSRCIRQKSRVSCESELLAELIPFLGVVTLGYDFLKILIAIQWLNCIEIKTILMFVKNIVKMLTIITSVDCFLCKT